MTDKDLMQQIASCSYHELNRFINGCFDDNAQILSRIEEKNQEKQREREAAEAEAAKVAAAKEANQDEEIAAALGDELDAFDVFDDDYGAETAAPAKKAEPAKPAEAPKKEAAAAATTDNTQQPKGQDAAGGDAGAEEAKDVQFAIGGEGGDAPANQDGGNQRGGGDRGRGGRRDYNNRQGRGGYDNRGRGDRRNNNYRGGRGGYNRGPVEDEDGFVVETGEKPKPRGNRGYGNRGGGRRDGNRGGGEFRGRGGGDRNNDRGGRGRGGRPQTSDGGAGDVAGAQQQPREIGAQSNTTDQGQV